MQKSVDFLSTLSWPSDSLGVFEELGIEEGGIRSWRRGAALPHRAPALIEAAGRNGWRGAIHQACAAWRRLPRGRRSRRRLCGLLFLSLKGGMRPRLHGRRRGRLRTNGWLRSGRRRGGLGSRRRHGPGILAITAEPAP